MRITEISINDELDAIVADINRASWDEANEISTYDVDSLKAYLKREDTIFITCYETSVDGAVLLGMASSRLELKPYKKTRWLYVDEVDVCADHRKKGAGKKMMQALLDIAQSRGCEELWLGTEVDNVAANALYQSLEPDDVLTFNGYTYETD